MGERYFCTGAHLYFGELLYSRQDALDIRTASLEFCSEAFASLNPVNDSEDILDLAVIRRDNGLILPGSYKVRSSETGPYTAKLFCSYSGGDTVIKPLTKDDFFRDTLQALKAKKIDLRQQGKGSRPNKSRAFSVDEENCMWQKEIFGKKTSFSIQFTLFYYLSLTMGLRGRDEHRKMAWGDVTFSTRDGIDCLIFQERDTKTRDGTNPVHLRSTEQIYFCECDTHEERCIIEIWKSLKKKTTSDVQARKSILPVRKEC